MLVVEAVLQVALALANHLVDERHGVASNQRPPDRDGLAVFDLATPEETTAIMDLFELHWDKLMGEMPLKIVYPALAGEEWMLQTGSDPKNVAWSYHNGGNWPVLIWSFVGAAVRCGRTELAERALARLTERIEADQWPEYYDGKRGGLVGRRAN